MHIPVEGAGDAELVGIGSSERGGEAEERDAPSGEVIIGREVDAEAVLDSEADDGLTHFGAAGGAGGEEERDFVAANNNNGCEQGAWIAPGRCAEFGKGGVDFRRIEADGELVGAVVGALVIVVEAPGLGIDICEGRNETVCVLSEGGDFRVIGERGVGRDFHEHFGERFGKAQEALAEVGSGDDGGGLVEGRSELGFCRWGEEGEGKQREREGDEAGHSN